MSKQMMPYENATSGTAAREETLKILRGFGCSQAGFMDGFSDNSLFLAFMYKGRNVQIKASAEGWARRWLQLNPHTTRSRVSSRDYQVRAMRQGMVAVNSIIRDWVKGEITAAECGIISPDRVFLPNTMDAQGVPLGDHMVKLLPAPKQEG